MIIASLPFETLSVSTEQTEACGAATAALLSSPHGGCVAFRGELGAGKTAFVRGFVSALAPGARVKSPTFALVNEYRGAPLPIYHFDMYRIDGEDDLYSTGFYDYLSRPAYILIEWSEKIPFALPDGAVLVDIEKTGETQRIIKIAKKNEQ